MVWRTVRGVLDEKTRNYIGLGALAGIHVHLRKELQWFGCRKTYARAIEQGITRTGELEVEQKRSNCW